MNIKKANELFGISLLAIGILKILLMIFIFIRSGSAAVSMINGKEVNFLDVSFISDALGIIQIILAFCSIIMILVNIKSNSETIVGYLIGILALGLEIILPAILFFIYGFVEGGLYIMASNKIRNKNFKLFTISEDGSAQKVESTDWFYNDKK